GWWGEKAPPGRAHDTGARRGGGLRFQVSQPQGRSPAPIRMSVGRPGQIALVPQSEHALHGYDQQSRGSVREVSRHRRKVLGLKAVLLQCLAQCLERAMSLLAGFAGIEAERPFDCQIVLIPPPGEGRDVMRSE